MKKIISVVLVLMTLLCFFTPASAASAEKAFDIVVTASAVSVNVGDSVNLTATLGKKGSSFSDCWSGAEGVATCLDVETGEYKAAAVFTAASPGTYTVSYFIVMSAGNSGTKFVGTGSCTIEVVGTVELVGAEIRDLKVNTLTKADGSVLAYSAIGTVYSLWSNKTSKVYGTINFKFGVSETSKKVSVTIVNAGVSRAFEVIVSRPEI